MSSHKEDLEDPHVLVGPGRTPPPDEPLADVIFAALREHAETNRVAQVNAQSGEELSFSALLTDSVRVAEGLRTHGLGPGHLVAFCSRHVADLYPAVLGAVFAGIAVFAADPACSTGELRSQLSLTKPKAIFAEPRTLEMVHNALQGLLKQPKVIVLDQDDVPAKLVRAGDMAYADLVREVPTAAPDLFAPPPIQRLDDHVPFVMAHASSGTVGAAGPKGVMLSDKRALHALDLFREIFPDEQGTFLATSQLSWATAMFAMLRCCWAGLTRVVLNSQEPLNVMVVIEKYKVTRWLTTPHVVRALAQHSARSRFDLSSLRAVVVTGESMSAEVQKSVQAALGTVLQPMYCVTEAGVLLFNRDGRPGAVGKACPTVSLKVVDARSGASLGPGAAGELRAKSEGTLKGYVGDPEATAALFDDQGWFCTGDVMLYDDQGYFYFVERLNENIQYAGNMVSAAELEQLIRKHPGVRDVAVLGCPHPDDGEQPMAFVVADPGASVAAQEIIDLVAAQLSEEKHLRGGVEFLDALPRTTSGKVSRRQLKDRLRNPLQEAASAALRA